MSSRILQLFPLPPPLQIEVLQEPQEEEEEEEEEEQEAAAVVIRTLTNTHTHAHTQKMRRIQTPAKQASIFVSRIATRSLRQRTVQLGSLRVRGSLRIKVVVT